MSTFTDAIVTEIEIDAPPERVWSILTDLDRYHLWNPFVVEASGDVVVGHRLRVRIQPEGQRATSFKPTVTAATEPLQFEWLGRLGLPGIFDGRHRFELEPVDGGSRTRFVQRESFSGVLVPVLRGQLQSATRAGFLAMNEAIKLRAEAAANRSSSPG